MDTSQSPLSELDLFCNWSGDPNDTIEVRMAIEVWCAPKTAVPILSTGFPIVRVKSASIRPFEPKSGVRGFHHHESCSQLSQTPERKPMFTPGEASSPLHSNNQPSLPDSESVIVRSDARANVAPGKTTLEDSYRSSIFDQTPATPNSLKRSAKAASLPDSVTDSERGYGGTKHRVKLVENDSQSPVASLRHSSKPSLIPRPVSSLNNQTEPARVPLPTDSAPVSASDFERFEELPLIQKEDVRKGNTDKSVHANQSLVDTDDLSVDFSNRAQSVQDIREGDLEKLSTVVSPGTPMGIESSPNPSSSSVGSPADEVFIMHSSPPVSAPINPGRPSIVIIRNQYIVLTPVSATPGQYSVSITFLLCLSRAQPKGWWNVTFPDLPRLQNSENGYVYFWIPPEQGIEIRTTNLKRYSINQACMMGQFALPCRFILPLRPCDGLFYGFLKDFKVTHKVCFEVFEDDDLERCRVNYIAVCSIDLIGRDFWSEKCGFCLYIHGGPHGSFTCNLLAPQERLQTIQLETERDTKIGISTIQVICPPASLASLTLSWQVHLPRKPLAMWAPEIKTSHGIDPVESGLQTSYEDKPLEFTFVKPLRRLELDPRRPRRNRFTRVWYSRKWRQFLSLSFLVLFCRLLFRMHDARRSQGHAVARIVEEVPFQVEVTVEVEVPSQVEDVPLVEGFAETEHSAEMGHATEIEAALDDIPTLEEPPAEIDITEAASQIEGISQIEDIPQNETPDIEPAAPSLSFRDRIDYLLGWRGPLGEL